MITFHNKKDFKGWAESEIWAFAAKKAGEYEYTDLTGPYPFSAGNMLWARSYLMGMGNDKKAEKALRYAVRGLIQSGVLIKLRRKGRPEPTPEEVARDKKRWHMNRIYWYSEHPVPENYEVYS